MRSVYLISGAFKLLNKNKAYHFVEINTASILKLNSGLKTQNSIPKNIFWNEISSNLNINDVFFIPGGNPLDIINEKNTFVTEKVIFDDNNVKIDLYNEHDYKDQDITKAFFVINEDRMYEELLQYY